MWLLETLHLHVASVVTWVIFVLAPPAWVVGGASHWAAVVRGAWGMRQRDKLQVCGSLNLGHVLACLCISHEKKLHCKYPPS